MPLLSSATLKREQLIQLHKLQQLSISLFTSAFREQAEKAQVLDFQPAATFVIVCFLMCVTITQRHSLASVHTSMLTFGIKKFVNIGIFCTATGTSDMEQMRLMKGCSFLSLGKTMALVNCW